LTKLYNALHTCLQHIDGMCKTLTFSVSAGGFEWLWVTTGLLVVGGWYVNG